MKDSCTNFFSQYDKALELIQKRFVEINETFIDYQSNYIRPAQINQAKVFKMETMMKQEIENREEAFNGLRKCVERMIEITRDVIS